jgi:hypothetical protein
VAFPAHDDATREAVLVKVRNGVPYRQISDEHGVATSTISNWAKTAGIESAGAEQVAAAVAATKVAWTQRRGELVDALGEAAAELLEKARRAPARDAQALMTAVAIGVDKAQLLSGGATSRHEQMDADARRERVATLRDELAERRADKETATGS